MLIFNGTTISFQSNGKFHTATNKHPQFNRIVELAKSGDFDGAGRLVDLKTVVIIAVQGSNVELRGNALYYKGEEVRGILGRRIVEMTRQGFNVRPLELFLENLMQNPSKRAVDELYGFLESAKLPITPDGHFLAYKSVRNDFKDKHSGKFDNSPGSICEMPRNKVDEDKNRTCSAGLHFAAHDYAKGFGGGSDRMVVLKINPKDVVAIPTDYNNQKGRTCKYEVVEEVSRSDTKLVNAGIVGKVNPHTQAAPVAVSTDPWPNLKAGKEYYCTRKGTYGCFFGFKPFIDLLVTYHGDGKFTGSQDGRKKTQWACRTDNEFGLSFSEAPVSPAYVPQESNYADDSIWDQTRDEFVGTAKQFPVNRDVEYELYRTTDSKAYKGYFKFVNYDVANDNLVFKRDADKDFQERYVTIANVSDWVIETADVLEDLHGK